MKRCPVDHQVHPDDAKRCSCGHRFAFKGGLPSEEPAPKGKVPILGSPPSKGTAIVRILEGGAPGELYFLGSKPLILARTDGDLNYPDDAYLSKRHASVRMDGTRACLRDLESKNGTFVRVREGMELVDGSECLIGDTLLKWSRGRPSPAGKTLDFGEDSQNGDWKVSVLWRRSGKPRTQSVAGDCTIGSGDADLKLDDEYVSALHAKVRTKGGETRLMDADSVNGLYARIPSDREHLLEEGALFRVGRQLFRFQGAGRPG